MEYFARTPKMRVKMPVMVRIARRRCRGVGMNGVGMMRTRVVVMVLNVRDTIVWL